ncbi:hypothetical protein NDU88_001895 [Pleurodeles waltl]|uniref:Uncharacterized protein n=1 Tax=Pleurodeles waltl TaxID=8319 RepID=A0AAV7SAA2_PLEWA|nr:hypothetical protein NDU88_001895 [Pleurodeles waltl]
MGKRRRLDPKNIKQDGERWRSSGEAEGEQQKAAEPHGNLMNKEDSGYPEERIERKQKAEGLGRDVKATDELGVGQG